MQGFHSRCRLHSGSEIRGLCLREFIAAVFTKCDVLLTPTLAVKGSHYLEDNRKAWKDYLDLVEALTRNTKVVNFMGLPAMTGPCGFDSRGLPVGMQLIEQRADRRTVNNLKTLNRAMYGRHRAPPMTST